MKLRWSPNEQVVRSTGDPPNGIVGFNIMPERCGFSVVSKVDPRSRSIQRSETDANRLGETTISTEEAVEALADESTALHLYGIALGALERSVMGWGIKCDFRPVRQAVDEAELYAELCRERFGD